jgi:hypothetical protein
MSKCLWFLAICAFGCSAAREAPASLSASAPIATAAESTAPAAPATPAAAGAADSSSGPLAASQALGSDRAVIRNASLQLTHKAPEGVTEQATALARAAGGYALDGTTQTAAGTVLSSMIVLRVPEPAFEELLGAVRKLATLREESITGQDVTDEFVDTEARLRALRKLEARLLGLLEQSAKLSDLLQVEQEVARVNGEIERFEGRLRYLRERTRMATITLTVKAPEQPYVPEHESIVSRLRNAFHAGTEVSVEVIESAIVVLGFILPASLAFAVLGSPVLWLWRWRRQRGRAKLSTVAAT